jgi:hypothetical protein
MLAMANRTPKPTVVAFKVEEDLANFLNGLPNKSEFIRRAIYSQLGIACPLCRGTGSVSKETHDHFAAFIEKWELHQCQGCGDEFAVPKQSTEVAGPQKEQLESLLKGGPDFCYTCFTSSGSGPAHRHD